MTALDVLDLLLVNDVLSSHDRMTDQGWGAEQALDALADTYRNWILGRFADAIDLGVELVALEVAPA